MCICFELWFCATISCEIEGLSSHIHITVKLLNSFDLTRPNLESIKTACDWRALKCAHRVNHYFTFLQNGMKRKEKKEKN